MLPTLHETIVRHGLQPKKALGQHFLLDENITGKIARAAGGLAGVNAIEIGPGPGGLTRALLAGEALAVHAVEKDARCMQAMAELQAAYPGRLHVLEADALTVALPALVPAPRAIVANLPYNVGTALLLRWLNEIHADAGAYRSLTLMFQREVAERIAAAPGGKEYGRLSVLAQWLCEVEHLFDLPSGAFSPPPKIYSSVICLTPRPAPLRAVSKEALERVLAAGFGQRRKMLRQSLKSIPGALAALEKSGIDPTLRAENLSVEQWCGVAGALAL